MDYQSGFNITQLAALLCSTQKTILKKIRKHQVKQVGIVGGVKLYAVADVARVLFAQETLQGESGFDPDSLPPKERKDYFQSERERVKLELEVGELIPDSVFRNELAGVLKSLVSGFETIPDDLERKCKMPPEVLEHIEEWADRQRMWLYNRLIELDVEET